MDNLHLHITARRRRAHPALGFLGRVLFVAGLLWAGALVLHYSGVF